MKNLIFTNSISATITFLILVCILSITGYKDVVVVGAFAFAFVFAFVFAVAVAVAVAFAVAGVVAFASVFTVAFAVAGTVAGTFPGVFTFAGAGVVAVAFAFAVEHKLSFWKVFVFNIIQSLFFGISFYFLIEEKETLTLLFALTTIFITNTVGVMDMALQHLDKPSFFVKKSKNPASA